jgi:hypothetical protein
MVCKIGVARPIQCTPGSQLSYPEATYSGCWFVIIQVKEAYEEEMCVLKITLMKSIIETKAFSVLQPWRRGSAACPGGNGLLQGSSKYVAWNFMFVQDGFPLLIFDNTEDIG